MNLIELKGLSKSFGRFKALKEIDLSLSTGQVLGFIGPNGAGKTTTIRIILGAIKGKGHARVFGMDPWRDSVAIHKNLAYVPGDVNLWPNLSGGEVIDLFLRLKNQKNKKYKEDLIEKFNLDPRKKCRTYSKGNRQKVALIAALSSDVDLYIFDEPTSGLDPLMEAVFQEEVERIRKEGRSILLSSHILSEVEALCDTISIIREGEIIESGRLEDLRHLRMSTVKLRLGRPLEDLGLLGPVHDLQVEGQDLSFSVGDQNLNQVLRLLSAYEIQALESKPPTLEEVFVRHYR